MATLVYTFHVKIMSRLRRRIATGSSGIERFARAVHRGVTRFTLPFPRLLGWPLAAAIDLGGSALRWAFRVFVCEPVFKSRCRAVGRGVRTGSFLHWVDGRGELIVGDRTHFAGKSSFSFAARYADSPTLVVGEGTYVGHNCSFTVGLRVEIGRDCLIANDVQILDSPGHPLDPDRRLAGEPAPSAAVRPVKIGDNVWIGTGAVILPGVSIGDGSVIATHAVVTSDVPRRTLAAGVPARCIRRL
jgi:acetyltransferase-like isoleucine patch superfamily enzyme